MAHTVLLRPLELATLSASLVATIKALSEPVLGHAGHDVRWAIMEHAWNEFASRRQVLADYCPGCVRGTENAYSTIYEKTPFVHPKGSYHELR